MTHQVSPIISTLRKLAVRTVANGCTEAEALTAMAKLAALMAEHNLTMDDIKIREEAKRCVEDNFTELCGLDADWLRCTRSIATYTGTRCIRSARYGDALGLGLVHDHYTIIRYFGLEVDVNAAICLSMMISNAITGETAKWAQALPPQRGRGAKARQIELMHSFGIGMADRVNLRLQEMTDAQATASSGAGALVVLKDQLISAEAAEWIKRSGFNLGRASTANIRINGAAYNAGHAAGAGVNLRPGHGLAPGGQARLTRG